jgi:hypothetical protein
MRFHLFCFSILAPLFLFIFLFLSFFLSLSLSLSLFSRILLLLGRDFTHWNFLGETLGK